MADHHHRPIVDNSIIHLIHRVTQPWLIKAVCVTQIYHHPWRWKIAAKEMATDWGNGRLRRWGWWKNWWSQKEVMMQPQMKRKQLSIQVLVLPQLHQIEDFKMKGTIKEAPVLGLVLSVKLPLPHFGGVALWVLR